MVDMRKFIMAELHERFTEILEDLHDSTDAIFEKHDEGKLALGEMRGEVRRVSQASLTTPPHHGLRGLHPSLATQLHPSLAAPAITITPSTVTSHQVQLPAEKTEQCAVGADVKLSSHSTAASANTALASVRNRPCGQQEPPMLE